jgi:hypothetical protein
LLAFIAARVRRRVEKKACQAEQIAEATWHCKKCGSLWRDSTHGQGWRPFGCPQNRITRPADAPI